MIDLKRLTPAPWTACGSEILGPMVIDDSGPGRLMWIYDEGGHTPADAAFIAEWRNAFDVLMRRGWGLCQVPGGWGVWMLGAPLPADKSSWGCWLGPDPCTAINSAEAWYVVNVEKKGPADEN